MNVCTLLSEKRGLSPIIPVGIKSVNAQGYQNQFGIALHVQTPLEIGGGVHALMADSPQVGDTVPMDSVLNGTMQSLLTEATKTLGFNEGEYTMLIADVPNAPHSTPQVVLVAQANTSQQTSTQPEHVLGVCSLVNLMGEGQADLFPLGYANTYYFQDTKINPGTAKITILQQPKHGMVEPTNSDGDWRYTRYVPNDGYLGNDSVVIQVEGNGYKVKLNYFLAVAADDTVAVYNLNPACKGTYWKISQDANGNNILTAVSYQSPVIDAAATSTDTSALASTLETSFLSSLSVDPSLVTLNIADLPGGAVGQTVGTTITLDTNAAGNNWFIDTTPGLNEEFLPTSNPNEWVSRTGSDAAGKMDMLSVLLHEYGHALGIEHSADNHDYMSTTLTPGVRRLPSAGELALMQELIGQAKNSLAAAPSLTLPLPQGERGLPDAPTPFPTLPIGTGLSLAFLGRIRKSGYGGTSIDVVGAPSITQYAVAANAAFTSLNTAAGWNTQGSVDIVSSTGTGQTGAATLNEVSTSQTRLNQVFMLNDKDRYLSFTLSGVPLPNPDGTTSHSTRWANNVHQVAGYLPAGEGANVAQGAAQTPQDAFEVALLDATTGLSVLGSDGLTHTDAFLNLQGDGTEHAASSVTRINNADGSRTYRVDLTGVAKNKAVNLSFDLLGFGVSNITSDLAGVVGQPSRMASSSSSHVTLRDIRVSGLPQLHDEVATIAEDNLLTFNPFAQIDAPSPTGGGLGWGECFRSAYRD